MPELVQLLVLDPGEMDAQALRRCARRHRARRIIIACDFVGTDDIGLETRRPENSSAGAVFAVLGPGANLVLVDRDAQENLLAAAGERGLPCVRVLD